MSLASSPAAIISAMTIAAVSSASTSSSRYWRLVRFWTTSTPSVRPALQHRNAEEGIVDLLARFRQVGEGRVLLRVGQVERAGAGRDRADKALAEPQLRQVDRTRVQTFGGVEFEHRIGAQHVERADLGHHVLGDVVHDAVEPLLRLERLRHQLAEPFQQNARACGHVTHKAALLGHGERPRPNPTAPDESGEHRIMVCYCLSRP